MNDNELKNFRFRVRIGDEPIGFMSVTGLSTEPGGWVEVMRAMKRDDFFLIDWWRGQEARDVRVTVLDVALDAVTFIMHGAKVKYMTFSGLHAGANQLFTETAFITYETVEIA